MDTVKFISERRSTRKFLSKPISKEDLETILQCGRTAPTGLNRQEFHFYPTLNKQLIDELADETYVIAATKMPHIQKRKEEMGVVPVFYNAPAIILITLPKTGAEDYGMYDVGAAAQNIILAAKALGIGSIPLGLPAFNAPSIYKKMGVPEDEKYAIIVALGYEDPEFEKFRTPKELTSKVTWV